MSLHKMNIVTSVEDWKSIRIELTNKTIGFVHTMGHLHAGHLSLCQRSQQENDITVVAIFINPTQFNEPSDFELYPRTIEHDKALLSKQKVDYLLLFDAKAIYHDNYEVQVTETVLSQSLEGHFRPAHFIGVLTVVLKYLNIVQPQRSYYGEKDYQQVLLIKKMVQALFLTVEVVACSTIRDEDGLALSSRNSRLSPAQRELAKQLSFILNTASTPDQAVKRLEKVGFKVDYVEDHWNRRLAAVWLDDIRLIDNIQLTS